jgi:hypothetical protein
LGIIHIEPPCRVRLFYYIKKPHLSGAVHISI